MRDRQCPCARLLDERRPDHAHDRDQLVRGHRLELPGRHPEAACGPPRGQHLLDLLAGAAPERIVRLLLAITTERVQPDHPCLRAENELEPDHLIPTRGAVERVVWLPTATRVLRCEVSVLR